MRKILFPLILFLLSSISYSAYATPTAAEVLAKADSINQLDGDMKFNVDVVTDKGAYEFQVFINNRENSIVKYIKPTKDKGKMILAKGLNMWVFIPSGKKPIRISPQQRLVGSVSNIDVARIALGVDYRADNIEPSEYDGKPMWLVTLKSNSSQSLYNKVKLWVEKNQFAPQKATFYTKSGQAAKTMIFADYQNIKDKHIAMTRIINDLLTGHQATLKYSNFEKSDVSNEYFQPNAFTFF